MPNRMKNRDQRWQAQRQIGAVVPGPVPPLHYPDRNTLQTERTQIDQSADAVIYHELYVYNQWQEYRFTQDNATLTVIRFPFTVKKIVVKNSGGASTNLFFEFDQERLTGSLTPGARGAGNFVCEGAIEREFIGLSGVKSIAVISDQAVAIQCRITIFG